MYIAYVIISILVALASSLILLPASTTAGGEAGASEQCVG